MKKLGMSGLMLVLFLSGVLLAQQEQRRMRLPMMDWGQASYGQMGRGMMRGMGDMSMMGMCDPLIVQLCHFGCPGFLLELSDDLDLTEQQISDLRTLMNTYQKFATQKKADMQIAKIDMSELLDKKKPDFTQVQNKLGDIAAMEKELRGQFLDTIEKSIAVLNEEQLTELQKYKITKDTNQMHRGMMHGMW